MRQNKEIRDSGKELYFKNYSLVAISLAFITFTVLFVGGIFSTLLGFSILKDIDKGGSFLIILSKSFFMLLIVALVLSLFNILRLGIINILAKGKRGEETKFIDLFFLFNDGEFFFKTVKVSLLLFLIYLSMVFLTLLPSGVIFTYIVVLFVKESSIIYIGILCSVIFFILVSCFCLIFTMFSQTYFVLYSNKDMKASRIIALSAEVMVSNKFKYIFFTLSYFGWNILGILTVVGVFFSYSYKYAGKFEFYSEIIENYLESEDIYQKEGIVNI